MQYANVLLDHRAGHRPLTYRIPADLLAHITVGSVVRVPFGTSTCAAVVSGFVRHVDPTLQSKLKSVTEVIQTGAFVPSYVLEAAHELHTTYGFRLGEMLFSLLPPFLKKRQTREVTERPLLAPGYRAVEYQMPTSKRPELILSLYERLKKKNLSLLVITASKPSAEALAAIITNHKIANITYPSPSTPAQLRRFFEVTDQIQTSTVIIGTRGALLASLHHVGAIIVDEPWLPGHKNDTYPKIWSSMTAHVLAKHRNIPLITLTATEWHETQLVYRPTRKISPSTGHRYFIERANISEVLHHFYEQSRTQKNRGVIFRPETTPQSWCPQCQSVQSGAICTKCHTPTYQFPILSEQTLREAWSTIAPNEPLSLIQLDALQQFRHFDALLLLHVDTLLTIVDYRMKQYLQTIVGAAQGQTAHLYIATRNQSAWIAALAHEANELDFARTHDLPPYGLPVELTATKKATLTQALSALTNPRMSPITPYRDGFRCVVHCRPPKIPGAWLASPNININPLPLYIEKMSVSSTLEEKTV